MMYTRQEFKDITSVVNEDNPKCLLFVNDLYTEQIQKLLTWAREDGLCASVIDVGCVEAIELEYAREAGSEVNTTPAQPTLSAAETGLNLVKEDLLKNYNRNGLYFEICVGIEPKSYDMHYTLPEYVNEYLPYYCFPSNKIRETSVDVQEISPLAGMMLLIMKVITEKKEYIEYIPFFKGAAPDPSIIDPDAPQKLRSIEEIMAAIRKQLNEDFSDGFEYHFSPLRGFKYLTIIDAANAILDKALANDTDLIAYKTSTHKVTKTDKYVLTILTTDPNGDMQFHYFDYIHES